MGNPEIINEETPISITVEITAANDVDEISVSLIQDYENLVPSVIAPLLLVDLNLAIDSVEPIQDALSGCNRDAVLARVERILTIAAPPARPISPYAKISAKVCGAITISASFNSI